MQGTMQYKIIKLFRYSSLTCKDSCEIAEKRMKAYTHCPAKQAEESLFVCGRLLKALSQNSRSIGYGGRV